MKLLHGIPALPVFDMNRSIEFYRDKLGFTPGYQNEGFAIFSRDDVIIHLWRANDERWRERDGSSPVVSGAESFIAGTASCRIAVEGVDALHAMLQPLGGLPSNSCIEETWFGTREFVAFDPDNNLITFFERK